VAAMSHGLARGFHGTCKAGCGLLMVTPSPAGDGDAGSDEGKSILLWSLSFSRSGEVQGFTIPARGADAD
jgi:hypothetical protein